MRDKQEHIDLDDSRYRNRIMACIIAAEIIALGFFNLWPIPDNEEIFHDTESPEDVLAVEDIVRTEQQTQPATPPRPQVPIPEPADEVIEEEITEIDDLNITDSSDTLSVAMLGNEGESDEPVANPQTSPSVIRIVEPTVPEAAKQEEIKAEIWVNFLVDQQGRVEEASISQIKLYDAESGEVRDVDSIDFGLTKATLSAALQWKFRPARDDGEPVKAYTRHIFTFGF